VLARVGCTAGLAGLVLWMFVTPGQAQSNLDAGKSAAQIFATTCSNCHRSAREIKRTTASFMREHYTTGSQEAATMAAYLAGIGSDPKAIEQRRRPAMGAGQGPSEAKSTQGGEKPSEAQANGRQAGLGRPRRPADSLEAGVPLAAMAAPAAESPIASPAPSAEAPLGDFEE
jgi:hypothetical protein